MESFDLEAFGYTLAGLLDGVEFDDISLSTSGASVAASISVPDSLTALATLDTLSKLFLQPLASVSTTLGVALEKVEASPTMTMAATLASSGTPPLAAPSTPPPAGPPPVAPPSLPPLPYLPGIQAAATGDAQTGDDQTGTNSTAAIAIVTTSVLVLLLLGVAGLALRRYKERAEPRHEVVAKPQPQEPQKTYESVTATSTVSTYDVEVSEAIVREVSAPSSATPAVAHIAASDADEDLAAGPSAAASLHAHSYQ